MKKSKVQQLRDRGFDEAYYKPGSGTWKVQCSQCVAAVINGMPCHETGCPNQVREEQN